MAYQIIWDNGHASGALYGRFETEAEAEAVAEDWLREMIAIDHDPAAAEEAYSYEVVEVT